MACSKLLRDFALGFVDPQSHYYGAGLNFATIFTYGFYYPLLLTKRLPGLLSKYFELINKTKELGRLHDKANRRDRCASSLKRHETVNPYEDNKQYYEYLKEINDVKGLISKAESILNTAEVHVVEGKVPDIWLNPDPKLDVMIEQALNYPECDGLAESLEEYDYGHGVADIRITLNAEEFAVFEMLETLFHLYKPLLPVFSKDAYGTRLASASTGGLEFIKGVDAIRMRRLFKSQVREVDDIYHFGLARLDRGIIYDAGLARNANNLALPDVPLLLQIWDQLNDRFGVTDCTFQAIVRKEVLDIGLSIGGPNKYDNIIFEDNHADDYDGESTESQEESLEWEDENVDVVTVECPRKRPTGNQGNSASEDASVKEKQNPNEEPVDEEDMVPGKKPRQDGATPV